MKPLFKNLVRPFRGTFLTLLFTVPQVPLIGSLSSQTALAQQTPSCPAGTRLENLNWQGENFQPGNFNQTLNIGGANVNFRMVENPLGIIKDISPENSPGGLGAVPYGIAPGPYGGINKPYLRWGIDARGSNLGGNATLIITADRPVIFGSPLLFLDVDRDRANELEEGRRYQDQITVTASNAGVNVPVTLVRGNNIRDDVNVPPPPSVTEVVGNVARGQNPRVEPGNVPPSNSGGNVAATFAGPVTTIQIIYESGPLYKSPNPGPGQDETIGLATDIGVCVPTALGSIGDTVFNDINANNVQDSGEPGIGGVEVKIRNSTGQEFVATTDANGKYSFPNLIAGQYTATVSKPPSGFTPTLTQPNPITLGAGQNYLDADFGFTQQPQGSLRLVKRITAIARTNGQRTQYNDVIDDPNDQNDNALNPPPVGQFDVQTPVQSGDEVEYTIYFRTEQSLENINLCDLIPTGTTYVPNSISVTGGGTGADQGRFFSPLTPIDQIPESSVCGDRTNPNGTVIVKLGNIPTAQSGSVSFRVKID
ncbi:collagen alpha 1(III) chain [Calothrix sp. NIES-2100]|nr:collagen alpha 1(III) chain [Calothrix sp. NIES-2100]